MDTEWFNQLIAQRYGSQRKFTAHFRGPGGARVQQSAISRMLSGEQRMHFHDAREFARLLQVPIIEVLIRAGAIAEADVRAWVKARRLE